MVEFSSSSSSDAEHSRALRRNAKSRARRLRRDQRAIVSLTTPTTTATSPLHGSRTGTHSHPNQRNNSRSHHPNNDPHRRHDDERSSSEEEEEEVLQDTHVSIAGEPVSVMRGTVYCPQRRRCFSIAQVASRPEAFFAMPSEYERERGGYRRARDTRRGGRRGALDAEVVVVPASAVEVADLLRVGRPIVTLDKARHNGFYLFVRLVVVAPSVQCPIVSNTNAVMAKHEEEEEEQIPDKVAGAAAGLNWQRKLPGRAAVWRCASSSSYLCHNPRLSSSPIHSSCSSDPVVIPMQKFGLVPEMALLNYGDPFRHTVLLRDPMEMVTQPFHHHHHTPGTSLWTLQRPSKSGPVGDGGDGGEDGSGVRSDRNDHPIRNAGQAEEPELEESGRILPSSFSSTRGRGKGTIYDCGSRWLLQQESMPLPGPRQPWRWVRSGGGQFAMAVGPGGRWCGWWGPSLRVVETHPGHTFDATQWVHVLPEVPVDRDLFYGVGPAAATVRGLHCAWAVVCEAAAEGKRRGKYHQQQQQQSTATGALRLLRVRGSRGASGEILDAKVPCGPNPTAVGCLLTSGGGDPNAPPNLLVGYQNGQIQFLSAQAPKLRWITPLPTASSSSLLSRSPVVALRGLTSVGFQSVQMNGEVKLWDIRKLQEPSKVVLQGGGVWGTQQHSHDERPGIGGVTTGAATAFTGSYGVVMRRGRATLWEGRSGDILHVWEGEGLVEHATAVLAEVPSGVVLLSAVKQHSGACTIDAKEWTRF